jgi:sugar fermentation stimulation protein A
VETYIFGMQFKTNLIKGKLLKRYKRFLADVILEDGTEVIAHCPNPGSMMGLAKVGTTVWLEPNDDPKKKLKYGWRLVEYKNQMICIDTSIANMVIKEALEKKAIPELSYQGFKPEVKYSDNSRIDFLLTSPSQQTYLEIKSVTLMREKGLAEFPDSITKRGSKHLADLSKMVTSGHKAVLLFLCMRNDVDRVRIAADLDSIYSDSVKAALKYGVQLVCYDTHVTRFGVRLGKPIVVEI